MRPLINAPVVLLIILLLYAELLILIIPLIVLYFLTEKDYSRGWMVNWAEVSLKKLGVKI